MSRATIPALAVVLCLLSVNVALADVVLWNKLGTEAEILGSEIGVNGGFGAPIGFGAVQHGDGVSIKSGTSQVRFDQIFGTAFPDAGTIEFWWIPSRDEAGSSSHYDERIPLWLSSDEFGGGWPAIMIGLWYGTHDLTQLAFLVWDNDTGMSYNNNSHYDLDFSSGQLMHFALVWNKAWGMSPHKLYVDGVEQVPVFEDQVNSNLIIDTIQQKVLNPGFTYDIELLRRSKRPDGAAYEFDAEMYVDNLVVWDSALDDFSHRFEEDPVVQVPLVNAWGLGALALLFVVVLALVVVVRRGRLLPSPSR